MSRRKGAYPSIRREWSNPFQCSLLLSRFPGMRATAHSFGVTLALEIWRMLTCISARKGKEEDALHDWVLLASFSAVTKKGHVLSAASPTTCNIEGCVRCASRWTKKLVRIRGLERCHFLLTNAKTALMDYAF